MKVCGIDPGKSGGLTAIEDGKLLQSIPMPIDDDGVDFNRVADFLKLHNPSVVYIERVHAMPGQGVTSMFNFGFSTGGLHGTARALGYVVKLVQPRTWQKSLMGDAKHEKSDTILFVQKLFPDVNLLATKRSKKPHDGMADSIGIGYYGYQEEINNINTDSQEK
jgi:Holliday junction resolvasome RuvABC endonuclease subunit